MKKNKQLGALPVGFTASIWGIKFKAVNQLDMFGGAVIILQSDNEDITTLTGNNTSKAVDEMFKWLKQQPKIQEQTVKEWKVTAKSFKRTSQHTFKVYAKNYYDAERLAKWKIHNEDLNYHIVSVKETGKELTDVLKKNIEELIVNLNGELREFNKGKNTAKRVKKTVVIEAPKTVVKTKKATSKNKTVKSSTMRQTGTSNKAYDMRKQAMKPGKRPSPSGKRPFYYEYRANRSDAGELLGIYDGLIDRSKASLMRLKIAADKFNKYRNKFIEADNITNGKGYVVVNIGNNKKIVYNLSFVEFTHKGKTSYSKPLFIPYSVQGDILPKELKNNQTIAKISKFNK